MQDTSYILQNLYQSRIRLQRIQLPASDAELRALWQFCQSPAILLQFMSEMVTRQQLVLAVAVCVRVWLGSALETLAEAQAALTHAEQWAKGDATLESVEQACELAMESMLLEDQRAETTKDPLLRQAAKLRSESAYACASVAHLVYSGDVQEDLDKALLYAREDAWFIRNAELTEALRQALPCPDLALVKRFYPSIESSND